jgi:hypothetical protein
MATTDDITFITQLVVRERESRDMGFWNRMRDCFHPDSVVNIIWFQGSGPDFVTASQGMASRGMPAKHRLGPSSSRSTGIAPWGASPPSSTSPPRCREGNSSCPRTA